jgi:hypothetical protein
MNSWKSLLVLLLFSLAAIVFQLAGGFSAELSMVATMSPGSAPVMPHPMTLLAGVASLLACIWGIMLAVRNQQWKWCIAIGFTTYIGACVYVICMFIYKMKKYRDKEIDANVN